MSKSTNSNIPSPLKVLYQDEWLAAIDKPAGYLVHPADEPAEGDLVAMKILRDQIDRHVYPIHRLDRPTSGVLLLALDREVARSLHQAFEAHEIKKTYWAVVDGHPPHDEWVCREPIQKKEGAEWKSAETEFHAMERLPGGISLVEATPKTGRFHQIRRHLLHEGYPIVGDYRYSGVDRCDELGAILGTGTRMLLQAKRLQLQHPVTGENLTIEAPVEKTFKHLLV